LRDHWRHPDAGGVIDLLERTGALTPGLNWYRANLPVESYVGPQPEFPSVTAPTLGIWSSRDIALVEEQMVGSRAFVDAPWHYERLDGIGHWLQLEAPDEVNALLLDFLER
jgi:pimeloyl-ACP methyl ester carboxylesterase